MKPILPCAVMSLLLAHPLAGQADATVYVSEGGDAVRTLQIRNGKVRANDIDAGNAHQYLIYDSGRKTAFLIDEQRRQVYEMNEQTMEKQMNAMQDYRQQMMTQMQEQLKGLPPAQRAMVEQQMAAMGAPPDMPSTQTQAPPDPVKHMETGERAKVNGISCKIVESYRGDTKTGRACVATARAAGMSDSDYTTLRNMFSHMQKLAKKAQSMAGTFAAGESDFDMEGQSGIPVSVTDLKTNEETRITRIASDTLADELFAVPAFPRVNIGVPGQK